MTTPAPATLTADTLRRAAFDSLTIPLENGTRESDPLRALIPGDYTQASAHTLALVREITGKTITREPGGVLWTAPAARATLRRWALKQNTTPEHYAPVTAALASLAKKGQDA